MPILWSFLMRWKKSSLLFLGLLLVLLVALILKGNITMSESSTVLEPPEVPKGMARRTLVPAASGVQRPCFNN
jgi:hypothetical protein